MPKVIGIVGSRSRDSNTDLLLTTETFLDYYNEGDTIVSGGCPKGGDRFAEVIAATVGCPIHLHKAEWDKYGKGAGFYRNTFIARDADLLIAVVSAERKGGTEDTIRKFLAKEGVDESHLILL